MELLYHTKYESCYGLGRDIYLFKPIDKSNTSFRMLNIGFINKCNEPITEIVVNPNKASISFMIGYIQNLHSVINSEFDHLEKNWDTRSHVSEEPHLTDLNGALRDLLNLDQFGEEIKEKFEAIIDVSKKVFDLGKEKTPEK